MMGTGKKMVVKDNGYPAPNRYTIRGFADDIKSNGDKINATRMMLIEKKKLGDIEKINMAGYNIDSEIKNLENYYMKCINE